MAGFFSDNTIEQIRSASDIVDVIGSYVPLKRAGANFTALCPFHKEKSPSFNVNPQRQIFHCFGCHKGGDVFTFVKEYENIPFPDAVRRLAERAKIPLETENNPGQQQSRHIKDSLLQIHEQITQRWQNALATEAGGQIARDYLVKRGVSEEAIKLFRLGYAPDAWDDTVNWAKSKGHELTLVEQGGLILSKEGGSYYDRFRGRLMFPICDEQGRVIGFSGRVLFGDQKTAKYVNSPETPIFTKGKVFFGLDKSKRALLDAQSAIVCEGQLDLIACFMAGVQNIVAPQGTALTADHARILKRYVDEVVLCFDSDNAGQNAAVRSLDSLLASGLAIRVAIVPAPHDPDSFIKESGGEAFKQLIAKADGFFDYYLNRLCTTNDLTTDRGRLTVMEAMAEAVNKTGNIVLANKYAQKTAYRVGVSENAMRIEFDKINKAIIPTSEENKGLPDPVKTTTPASRNEFALLQLLFQNEDLAEWAAKCLEMEWIQHPFVRQILVERILAHDTGNWQGLSTFLSSLSDTNVQSFLTDAVSRNYMEGASGINLTRDMRDNIRGRALPNPLEDLKGILTRLRNEHLSLEIKRLTTQIATLEACSEEQVELFRKIESLKLVKKQPVGPKATPNADEPF